MDKERIREIAEDKCKFIDLERGEITLNLGGAHSILAFAAAIEREAFISGAAAQREADAGLCQLVSVSYTFEGAKETAQMCENGIRNGDLVMASAGGSEGPIPLFSNPVPDFLDQALNEGDGVYRP